MAGYGISIFFIQAITIHILMKKNHLRKNVSRGAAQVALRFGAAFSPDCDPGDPELSPTSGSLHSLLLPQPVSLPLTLSVAVSLMNK